MVDVTTVIGRDDGARRPSRDWLTTGSLGPRRGPGRHRQVDARRCGRGARPASRRCRLRGLRHMGEVPLLPIRLALPGVDPDATVDDVRGELLDRLTAARLVVDDLQFCDPDTLTVVAELAMRAPVVATAATGAVGGTKRAHVSAPRRRARGARAARPGCGPHAARAPAPGRAGLRRRGLGARGSDGNPYELRLHALGRIRRVVDDATLVAALAPPLQVALAETAAGAPRDLTGAVADELLAAGVIRLDGDGHAWPLHDRLGEAALAVLGPASRAEIHRRLALAADGSFGARGALRGRG